MKKLFLLGCLIFLLTACSSKQGIDPVFDLRNIGSTNQTYLAQPSAPASAPEEKTSQAHSRLSAMITQGSSVETSEDGTVLLRVQYPETIFEASLDPYREDRINALLLDRQSAWAQSSMDALTLARSQFDEAPEDAGRDFYEYSYLVRDNVTRLDERVLSIVSYSSSYLGGSHPDNRQEAWNLDVLECRRLSLWDVLTENGREVLCDMVLSDLSANGGDYGFFSDYEELVKTMFCAEALPDQWDHWYLTEDRLVLFFNPYDISPYAAGIVSVEFAAEKLDGLLSPEYFPEIPKGRICGAFLAGPEGELLSGDQIYAKITPMEGENRFAILGRRPIYDLTVEYVQWVGDQAASRSCLYRTASLDADDALLIEIDSEAHIPDLCIRFNPGDGVYRTVRFDGAVLEQIRSYDYENEE